MKRIRWSCIVLCATLSSTRAVPAESNLQVAVRSGISNDASIRWKFDTHG